MSTPAELRTMTSPSLPLAPTYSAALLPSMWNDVATVAVADDDVALVAVGADVQRRVVAVTWNTCRPPLSRTMMSPSLPLAPT